jgi:hypothetical protein
MIRTALDEVVLSSFCVAFRIAVAVLKAKRSWKARHA